MNWDILKSVVLGNSIGVVLMLEQLLSNSVSRKEESDLKTLMFMSGIASISCLADILVYAIDGMSGSIVTMLVYFLNSWLFFSNMLNAFLWFRFTSKHIGANVPKPVAIFNSAMFGAGILLLFVNYFIPLVFSVKNNVYGREAYYYFYVTVAGIYMLESIIVYLITKRRGGLLLSFPVFVFLAPIILGIVIQSMFYGISVIWVGVAIGVSGMITTLKNELIYIDQMAGTYNRYYLEYLKERILKTDKPEIIGIMADINGFKKVNDMYGHRVGDEAIVQVAKTFNSELGGRGKVIRYAGDEFVIIINTKDEEFVEDYIQKVNEKLHNLDSVLPCKISVSMDYHLLDLETQTLDEFFDTIDSKMYAKKMEYYKSLEA